MNKTHIRIIAAACFVPLLVANIQTLVFLHAFDVLKVAPLGPAIANIALSLLPTIVHLLIIAGVLFQAPVALGTGAMIMAIHNASSLVLAIWPIVMNSHNYGSAVLSIMTILSYSALALTAFIPKRGKLFGIIAAVFTASRIIVYIVFAVKLSSPLVTVINNVCFAAGAVLIGIVFAEKARVKAEASVS